MTHGLTDCVQDGSVRHVLIGLVGYRLSSWHRTHGDVINYQYRPLRAPAASRGRPSAHDGYWPVEIVTCRRAPAMMNLRHLKLWKRGHNNNATGNSNNDVIGGSSSRAVVPLSVDWDDVRSPSSDSGYSDVVVAAAAAAAASSTCGGPPPVCLQFGAPSPATRLLLSPVLDPVVAGRSSSEVTSSSTRRSKSAVTMHRLAPIETTSSSGGRGNFVVGKNVVSSSSTAGGGRGAGPSHGGEGGGVRVPACAGVVMEKLVGLIRTDNVERFRQMLNDTRFDVNTKDQVSYDNSIIIYLIHQ